MRCLAAKLRPFDPGVDIAMPSTRSSLPEIRPDLAAGGPAGIWRSHPIENEPTAPSIASRSACFVRIRFEKSGSVAGQALTANCWDEEVDNAVG